MEPEEYYQGFRAYTEGVAFKDNPCRNESLARHEDGAWKAWNHGWNAGAHVERNHAEEDALRDRIHAKEMTIQALQDQIADLMHPPACVRYYLARQSSSYKSWVRLGPGCQGWGGFNKSEKHSYEQILSWLKIITQHHQ